MGGEVVTLLQQTVGRDKLLKAAAGLCKVLAFYTGASNHAKLASSLSEARSILRLGGWMSNIKKFTILPTATTADRLMILRVALDMFYCVHDNLRYLTLYKVANPAPYAVILHRSFMGIFWGFTTAVILDLYVLATQKLDKKALRKRLLLLTRNICDMLAGLHNVGYAKRYGFNLDNRVLGILGFISGAISTRDNYNDCFSPKK